MVEEKYRAFLVDHLRTGEIRHSGRDFYTHLKGTHDLLRAWENPEPVCLAGLFHSIYGTLHFRRRAFPIHNRRIIRDLIGEEAEFLAYVFCVTERPKAFLAQAAAAKIVLYDDYADEIIRLSRSDLNKLLEIEVANLVEQGGKIRAVLQQLLATEISRNAKAGIAAYLERQTTSGVSSATSSAGALPT